MRIAAPITLFACLALALPAGAQARGGCAHANASIAAAGGDGQAHAILCLINWARSSHGLRRLHASGPLRRAAERHSADMVRRRYFDHTGPRGDNPMRRVRRAGYHPGTLGETIAYGDGSYGTAAMTVHGWLHSAEHRRILLDPVLRDIGIGVAAGTPDPGAGDGGITVTADLGRR